MSRIPQKQEILNTALSYSMNADDKMGDQENLQSACCAK
jgi:hypothetical protein